MSATDSGLLRNVQALRAISALLVVVAHLDKLLMLAGLLPAGRSAVGLFSVGVTVFFAISGFIMVHTTREREVTPIQFMMQRIARVVPIYWLVTLVVFGLALTLPNVMQATHANWNELAKSLAFIPFVKSNGLMEPVLFVGWSLNYEMFFYVLFALGLLFSSRVIGALSVVFWLLAIVGIGVVIEPASAVGRFYSNSVILEFALGMLVALLLPRLPQRAGVVPKLFAAMLALAGIGGAVVLPYALPVLPLCLVCGLPAALTLMGVVMLDRWGWTIKNPKCLVLGNASYSLYLTHAFVTQAAQQLGLRLNAHGLFALVLVCFAITLSCCLGVVVYNAAERPLWQMARLRLTGIGGKRPLRASLLSQHTHGWATRSGEKVPNSKWEKVHEDV